MEGSGNLQKERRLAPARLRQSFSPPTCLRVFGGRQMRLRRWAQNFEGTDSSGLVSGSGVLVALYSMFEARVRRAEMLRCRDTETSRVSELVSQWLRE